MELNGEKPFVPCASEQLLRGSLRRWSGAGKSINSYKKSINSYKIPRIAVFMSPQFSPGYDIDGVVGSVDDEKIFVERIGFQEGSMRYISTAFCKVVGDMRTIGNSARYLAEEIYLTVGREDAFCAAVALWDPAAKKWELALKNKNWPKTA